MLQNDIENLVSELPPARQQAARRALAKLAEENPTQHLLFELTLVKLAKEKSAPIPVPSADPKFATELARMLMTVESAQKDTISEVVQLRRELNRLNRVEEDAKHIRECTDRTESKLDAVRPYRAKVAMVILGCMLAAGFAGGWYGRIAYAKHQFEQYMRNH